MLALPNISLLSIPILNLTSIAETISDSSERYLKSNIESLTKQRDAFHKLAYEDNNILSQKEMKSIERLDDFFLVYSDILSDLIEDDENRASSLYGYIDDMYTLSLNITTSISYLRSKNRQLENAA